MLKLGKIFINPAQVAFVSDVSTESAPACEIHFGHTRVNVTGDDAVLALQALAGVKQSGEKESKRG